MGLFKKKSKEDKEMDVPAEKPQSLSMALGIARTNKKKPQKMAAGGVVSMDQDEKEKKDAEKPPEEYGPPESKAAYWDDSPSMYADGGEVEAPKSAAECIMRKRKAKMMAEGGMVEDEKEMSFDELNEDAAPEADPAMDFEDDKVSLEEQDIDDQGRIAKIMSKMRARRG